MKNQGRYTPDAGKVKTATCGICGDKMNVERDQLGPTSWAGAMAGAKRKHDSFTCPNLSKDWHVQIVRLLREIENTSSGVLTKILQKEVDQIKKDRKHTKKVSAF